MSLGEDRSGHGEDRVPRVSGDEPLSARLKAVKLACSPRERG